MDSSLSRASMIEGRGSSTQEENAYLAAHHVILPQDQGHKLYLALFLSGVGILLPYNAFISSVDFLHISFPGSSIVFDISLIYILTALLAVVLNSVIMEMFSLQIRIIFGYLLSLLILLAILVLLVWLDLLPQEQSYGAVLAAVACLALGCTVQQSSYYGLTSQLPTRFTQAVMVGESGAGIFASLARIATKAAISDSRTATALFFLSTIFVIMTCIVAFLQVLSL